MSQREAALAHANEIRLRQAAIRIQLRALDRCAGLTEVARLLAFDDADADYVRRMRVGYLLHSIHRVGDAYSRKLMVAAGLRSGAGFYRVEELTDREVGNLRRELMARA